MNMNLLRDNAMDIELWIESLRMVTFGHMYFSYDMYVCVLFFFGGGVSACFVCFSKIINWTK